MTPEAPTTAEPGPGSGSEAASESTELATVRQHLLTVAVEDFFHATALATVVPAHHWGRFDSRVLANLDRTLELLDRFGHRATFFVLGWIAERVPEVPRKIVAAGHEVASKGFEPRTIRQMTPEVFRADALRARQAIEDATGLEVLGHRVARGTLSLDELWALDILAEEGYRYDSSIYPRMRSVAPQHWRRFAHVHRSGEREIWEFPLSTWGNRSFLVPAAGGNYVRQLPAPVMRRAFARWERRYEAPFNMYFHIWELDPDMPRIATAGIAHRVRQYRNLDRMQALLEYYLLRYRFGSIADRINVTPGAAPDRPRITLDVANEMGASRPLALRTGTARTPISIVIPCYNEAAVLPFLSNTLKELSAILDPDYDVMYVFVDDRSTDDTWDVMQRVFGDRDDVKLVQHEVNQGVAEAILTGIRAAKTDVVCSMDCDCSYDPRQMTALLPMLMDDVAMVTASPYHDEGAVMNVPSWRLFLSHNLSRLYRVVLRNRLATYTSCFRVYRREKMVDMALSTTGFLGVAEMLGQLDLNGERIVECPAVLEPRILGRSKMKTVRTIVGHLGLLGRLGVRRVTGPRR